jgi:FkbM family methyltransferase
MNNFYAEHNIDQIIREKYFTDYSYKGTILEVGAATPTYLSMTKHFKENGWRAVHVEPNPIFIQNHLDVKNEIYPYACGEHDADNVDFTVVSSNNGEITDHSYSSFNVKEGYKDLDPNYFNSLKKTIIKVNCRKLDSILTEANINNIDVLSIDTEGWEIEVMKGLTKIEPKVIILENLLNLNYYTEYMESRNYKLDHIQVINYVYIKK